MDRLAENLSLPVVIKPCSSVCDTRQLTKHFVRTAYTTEDAVAYLKYLAAEGSDALLQPRFDGAGVGVELLASEGEVLVAIQHQRLHETNGFGSTYRETVSIDEDLRQACTALMRALNFTGLAMVEFRLDFETGKWVLLEINGRCWGSLPLAVAAGANFPLYLYQMLVERQCEFPQDYQTGIRSRSLTNDIRWTWRRVRGKGKTFSEENKECLGWSVNAVSYWQVAKDLVRGLLLVDHIDTLAWDDPAPFFTEATQIVSSVFSRSAEATDRPADLSDEQAEESAPSPIRAFT